VPRPQCGSRHLPGYPPTRLRFSVAAPPQAPEPDISGGG
jgi:hypothetical protein